MQYLKPKFLPQAEQISEKKSGIKDIICPEPCSPLWQRAFTLADNVRFTRTPDNEIVRRRAAIDPVYAKILAEAKALKSAHQQQLAEEKKAEREENQAMAAAEAASPAARHSAFAAAGRHETAEKQAEAEPQRAAENRGYETIAHMREEAEAAFAGAALPAQAPKAAAPAQPETKEEQEELPPNEAPRPVSAESAAVSAPPAAASLPYAAADAPPVSLPAAAPAPAEDITARRAAAVMPEAPETAKLKAETAPQSPPPQAEAPALAADAAQPAVPPALAETQAAAASAAAPAEQAAAKAISAEKTAPAAKKTESAPAEIFPWNVMETAAETEAKRPEQSGHECDSAWISRRQTQNGGHGLWISRRHAQAEEEEEKAEAESAAMAFAAAPEMPAAAPMPEEKPQMDITRLFKVTECRRPQQRWIPVPAALAAHLTETHIVAGLAAHYQRSAGRAVLDTQANPAAFAAAAPPPESAAFPAGGYGFSQMGGALAPRAAFAAAAPVPALNLQLKLDGYNSAQDRLVWEHHQVCPAAAGQNAPQSGAAESSAAAANLDTLCSSAIEKSGKTAAPAFPPAFSAEKPAAAAAAAQAGLPAGHSGASGQHKNAARPKPQAKHEARHGYKLPAADLLQPPVYHESNIISQEVLERSAGLLESVLEDFGVKGEIIHVRPGPVVTLYEFEPAPGVKSSRVIGLSEDIARSMSSVAARVAVIPGRNVIGIELPNKKREMVYLREILQSAAYKTSDYKLPLALGKNIGGEPIIAELAKMPHLLVAGTTGSGKSVAINTMILSLIYRMTPQECRLIMVDPKMLELSVYDGIPHLLTPVVTDPKKALSALKWAVREMEARYRKMAKLGVRNIDGFNLRIKEAVQKRETIMCTVQAGFDKETGELLYTEEAMDLQPLPYIVIIVDEMADLMMVAGKEIEGAIQRLAQMARAAGLHLIMATQRPSVDVITGTIKANFPTRISFQVTSKIDSRTILGEQGAEALLGQGDMLHMAGGGRLKRIHGPFVSDREVEKVVAHLKTQGTPEYLATVTESNEDEAADGKNGAAADSEASAVAEIVAAAGSGDDFDDLYLQAVKIVMRDKKCSTSYIQRRLGIGYNKAAGLVEKMEEEGLVGEANHVGKREILINN